MQEPSSVLSNSWMRESWLGKKFFSISLADRYTLSRVPCIPLLSWFLYIDFAIGASLVLAWAAYSDIMDGRIARREGTVSKWGQRADELIDKALMWPAFVVLSFIGTLPLIIPLALIGRDLAVTWMRSKKNVPSVIAGKAKTWAEVIGVAFFILHLPLLGFWGFMVAVALSYISFAQYVGSYVRGDGDESR